MKYEIKIRTVCPKCNGEKSYANPDEDAADLIPFVRCIWCDGCGTIEQWISLEKLMQELTTNDLSTLQARLQGSAAE